VTGCAAIVLCLALIYHHQRHAGDLDATTDSWLTAQFGADSAFLNAFLHIADLPSIIAILAVVAAVALARRRADIAVLAVAGPLASILVTELLLKPLARRTYGGWLSYPSGHTAGTVAVAAVFGMVLLGAKGLSAALRIALALVLLAVCAVVSTALITLGYHYFTDTVGGFFLSVGMITLVALGIDWAREGTCPKEGTPARD
jgi:membrane-associated phospholipid phosphatase